MVQRDEGEHFAARRLGAFLSLCFLLRANRANKVGVQIARYRRGDFAPVKQANFTPYKQRK
jgi:hypothetical protein